MTAMRASLILALAAFALACFGTPRARAEATFYIYVMDGPNEGFNDPTPFTPVGGNPATTLGEARLNAFRRATEIWGHYLDSPVGIEVRVWMDPLSCTLLSGVLGHATSPTVHKNFTGAPIWDTYYPQALANSLYGSDLAPLDVDIEATFNSDIGSGSCMPGNSWYYGLDGNASSTQFDFVTVALHELGHGLGVQTYVNLNTGQKFMLTDDGYERNLEQHFATPFWYPSMSDAQRVVANTSDPDLHWYEQGVNAAGQNLSAGYVNGHVRMHGPSTLSPGSSVNHFSNALVPDEVMEATYNGPNHDPGLALNLLNDIGWKIANKSVEVCDGSVIDLTMKPPRMMVTATGGMGSGLDNVEHGAFVTALQDVDVCAIGMEADYFVGQTITVTIYDASGNSRGPVIASASTDVDFRGNHIHYIPISASLEACHDYDISVLVSNVFTIAFWLTPDPMYPTPAVPFDAAGVIRVRQGERAGGTLTPETPHLSILGEVTSQPAVADLTEAAITWGSCHDALGGRGAFVTALKTARVTSVSFEADFLSYSYLQDLRANIYEATGTVRGNLIATGVVPVTTVGSPMMHEIPVNALLEEGKDYDIEVVYPDAMYSCWIEGPMPSPFSVDGVLTVVDGELDGNAADPILPHLAVAYADGPGGDALDLAGPFHGPPSYSPAGGIDGGMYVLATNNGDINSIGWMGDVTAGQTLTAQVYESTGLGRGALVAEGQIDAAESGMRWRDIPLAADLVAGQEYDLALVVGAANQWPWWDDTKTPVVPYDAWGFFSVLDGETGGDPTGTTLLQMRVNMCPSTVVGVEDRPAATPRFTLAAPYPNPASSSATLRFSLDREEPVSVAVYDVAGRRVATLVDHRRYPAGPAELHLDTRGLVSGVYFVRLQTPARSLSRRMVLVR